LESYGIFYEFLRNLYYYEYFPKRLNQIHLNLKTQLRFAYLNSLTWIKLIQILCLIKFEEISIQTELNLN
jgi:hypothetical protein